MLKPCSLPLKKCLKFRLVKRLNSYVCFQCESTQCPCELSTHLNETYKSRSFFDSYRSPRNYWLSAIIGIFLFIVLIIVILIIVYFIQFYLKKRRRNRLVVNNSGLSRMQSFYSSGTVWFTRTDSSPPDYNNVKLDKKNSNSTDFLPPYATIN